MSIATLEQKIVGMIVGAITADAATQPVHWVYDQGKLASLEADIEFHEPALNPFYRLANGKNTNHGDQAFVLLEHLSSNQSFDRVAFSKLMYEFFGSNGSGGYGPFPPRSGGPSPQILPWRSGSIRNFLTNVENSASEDKWESSGVNDDQSDGLSKVVGIVALHSAAIQAHSGDEAELLRRMLDQVEQAVKITQTGETILSFSLAAARILREIVRGKKIREAIEEVHGIYQRGEHDFGHEGDERVAAILGKMLEAKGSILQRPHREIAMENGLACSVTSVFANSIHILLQKGEESFEESVRETIRAGGENASRSLFVGACVGANLGIDAIPQSWQERVDVTRRERVLNDTHLLVGKVERQ